MKVMRPWEWAFPPAPVKLEIRSNDVDESDYPPLLFVHGLSHGAWCFDDWLEAAAAAGFAAHAVSLRGHGSSSGRVNRSLLRDYDHDVLQAIATVPEPPVIVAHSLGGLVAQSVMRRYPARAVVLLTPVAGNGIPFSIVRGVIHKPVAFAATLAGRTLRLTADDLFAELSPEQADLHMGRLGAESAWAQYAMMVPGRVSPAPCPTLVIGAEQDKMIAAADVRRCARALHAELDWVPGGHDVMLDGPRFEVLDVVLEWVRATCQPGQHGLPGARLIPPLGSSVPASP